MVRIRPEARRRGRARVALLAAAGLVAAAALPGPAAGETVQFQIVPSSCQDCDADGAVTVDELVTHVGIALEVTPLDACAAGDADGDGAVAVHEIVAAVHAALAGCPLDEVFITDWVDGGGLDVVRNGPFLRFVFTDDTGCESDISVRIEGWASGVTHEVTALWRDGPTLYIDESMVGTPSDAGPMQVPDRTPLFLSSDWYGSGYAGAGTTLTNFPGIVFP